MPRRGVPPFGSHSTQTTAEECCHPSAGGGRTIDSQSAPPYGGAHDSTLGAAGSSARLGGWAVFPRARGREPGPDGPGLAGGRRADRRPSSGLRDRATTPRLSSSMWSLAVSKQDEVGGHRSPPPRQGGASRRSDAYSECIGADEGHRSWRLCRGLRVPLGGHHHNRDATGDPAAFLTMGDDDALDALMAASVRAELGHSGEKRPPRPCGR
jgi:hypothetical protein